MREEREPPNNGITNHHGGSKRWWRGGCCGGMAVKGRVWAQCHKMSFQPQLWTRRHGVEQEPVERATAAAATLVVSGGNCSSASVSTHGS
eukprot:superscaffoldBa00000367_g4148